MFDLSALFQGLLDTLLVFIQEYLVELVSGLFEGGPSLF